MRAAAWTILVGCLVFSTGGHAQAPVNYESQARVLKVEISKQYEDKGKSQPPNREHVARFDETRCSISRLTIGAGRDQQAVLWTQAMSHSFVRLILEANQQPVKD